MSPAPRIGGACPATYTPWCPGVALTRERDQADHIGDHHGYLAVPARGDREAWTQLWVWASSGAAHGFNHADTLSAAPCSVCGTPHDRSAAMRAAGADLDVCFHCALWDRRAGEYAAPGSTLLRPHGDHGPFDGRATLYSWAVRDPRRPTAGTGAFGDRKYAVITDDGRTFGPDSRLWSGGEIPWWRTEEFPPNCTIEQTPRPVTSLDRAGLMGRRSSLSGVAR